MLALKCHVLSSREGEYKVNGNLLKPIFGFQTFLLTAPAIREAGVTSYTFIAFSSDDISLTKTLAAKFVAYGRYRALPIALTRRNLAIKHGGHRKDGLFTKLRRTIDDKVIFTTFLDKPPGQTHRLLFLHRWIVMTTWHK